MAGTLKNLKLVEKLGQAAGHSQKLHNAMAKVGDAADPLRKAFSPQTRVLADATKKAGTVALKNYSIAWEHDAISSELEAYL